MHLQHHHLGNNSRIAAELVIMMPVLLGKTDNTATGTKLLPRPSSRQRASRGRKHVGKVVDNNRLHGFTVDHKDSKEFNRGSGGGDHQSNQHGIGQVGADTFQGGSDKSEVADFLNSWNRLGRARPKTSDASRQRRQRSGIPAMNSNRRRGTNNTDLVTEDLMIISMSPISIKPRSKDDIFRLGDFDKHVTPANPNNAQRSDDNNSTQLPPFGDTLLCLATVVNKIFIMEKK